MIKYKLRKEIKILLALIIAIAAITIIKNSIDNYNDYLNKCDQEKGYTCNIFGN